MDNNSNAICILEADGRISFADDVKKPSTHNTAQLHAIEIIENVVEWRYQRKETERKRITHLK